MKSRDWPTNPVLSLGLIEQSVSILSDIISEPARSLGHSSSEDAQACFVVLRTSSDEKSAKLGRGFALYQTVRQGRVIQLYFWQILELQFIFLINENESDDLFNRFILPMRSFSSLIFFIKSIVRPQTCWDVDFVFKCFFDLIDPTCPFQVQKYRE